MFKYLLDLRDRQNKEEVNIRKAKKRSEVQDTALDTETPSKVKRVEVEIEKEEKNVDENIGELFLLFLWNSRFFFFYLNVYLSFLCFVCRRKRNGGF